ARWERAPERRQHWRKRRALAADAARVGSLRSPLGERAGLRTRRVGLVERPRLLHLLRGVLGKVIPERILGEVDAQALGLAGEEKRHDAGQRARLRVAGEGVVPLALRPPYGQGMEHLGPTAQLKLDARAVHEAEPEPDGCPQAGADARGQPAP